MQPPRPLPPAGDAPIIGVRTTPGHGMNTTDLLHAVRAAHGLPSNYALARFLDVRETTLWRWSSGRNTPDDPTAARLAELAGLDPDSVVAAMHAERAQTEAERARWHRIADRLKGFAAGVLAALFFGIGGPPNGGAHASAAAFPVAPATVPSLLIMSTARRAARWLAAQLKPHPLPPIGAAC